MRTSAAAPGAVVGPLLEWYRLHRRRLPWRASRDPYRVWVAEIMLQQTTVRAVIPYYRRFLRRFPAVRALAAARVDAVLAAWSGLGYYRRARHLHAAARVLVERHAGRFPETLEAALALPGVGRYTAGAVLSIAYGLPHPVVDGNVARVLSRVHLVRGRAGGPAPVSRLWAHAARHVAVADDPGDLNQALMELGATVCTPRMPSCPACPIARACAARARGVQEAIPPPRRRPAARTVRADVALVCRNGRMLMHRRSGTSVMEGLWELPSLPARTRPGALRIRADGRVATVRHSIMNRRYVVAVRRARLLGPLPRGGGFRWVSAAALDGLPTSSLVRKVLAGSRSVV